MSQEIIATGRRKDAVARIRMTPGTGVIEINGRPFEEYFKTSALQNAVLQPLEVAKSVNIFDIRVNTTGLKNPSCHTISKAFEKFRKTASVCSLLFNAFRILSWSLTMLSIVLLHFQKQLCRGFSILWMSKYHSSLVAVICSNI